MTFSFAVRFLAGAFVIAGFRLDSRAQIKGSD